MIFNKTMKRFFYVIELYGNTGFSEKLSVGFAALIQIVAPA